MKKTMKKLSLHRETIVDLAYVRVSGASNKPFCTTSGTTETTTTVDPVTVSTFNSAACNSN